MNTSIFKSYDIRGIYPEELNAESAFKVGQVFVSLTKAKKIIVGRDMRLSSPELLDGLIKGITSLGADVVDIRQVMSEVVYFAVGSSNCDAGIMITASHNPKEYNGFKMLEKKDNLISIIRGKDMQEIAMSEIKPVEKSGQVTQKDFWPDYIKHCLNIVDLSKIKKFKIVVDSGNGMSGKLFEQVKNQLPVEIININSELDGNFPAHPSNFLELGATNQVAEEIKKQNADFGFVFDGDADRVRLLDENGQLIDGDISLIFMAKYFLQKNPGTTIAYTATCSKAVKEWVEKWGGKVAKTPVGFVNVRDAMIKNNGLFSGEHPSSHYSFKDNFYCDSGFLAFLYLLIIISDSGKKVSELVKEIYHYHRISETNFKVVDKQIILDKIKQKYSDGQQDFLDGISVYYQDWWFNVRASNTEPLLRLNIEANTSEILESKKEDLTKLIRES